MISTETQGSVSGSDVRVPSVLAVLVVKDGSAWLRDCLQALSSQTHPKLGVIAVDGGSADGSRELLEQALGAGRVVAVPDNPGVAGSVNAVLDLPAATEADYLLVVHDDTALAPDAVAKMLDAAEGIRGLENVGVVGPKIVDWDDPRVLREVGRSTDRFGHPYTPLQDGERDQGQYDRVLEVLFVSSAAMLVSREAWQRAGRFDERMDSHHEDLDFCWRARLAGFRVLMTPLAVARHRGATARGERREQKHHHSSRYWLERAALATMIKNYGVVSLAWLLPLHVIIGGLRVLILGITRRFEDAFELLSAWTWNLVHLPSTIRRRVRSQAVRKVRDRQIRRFMESATFRLPRWFDMAGRILAEQHDIDHEQPDLPVRARAASLARTHPALVAWAVGGVVAYLAFRSIVGADTVNGGALAAFPAHPGDFLRELVSGVRTTGLGGDQAASPALALMGGVSTVLFRHTALTQKTFLMVLPLLAGVLAYRAMLRETGERAASVVTGVCYTLSAVTMWAFSEGRIDVLVTLTVLPPMAERLETAFASERPAKSWRFLVGLGVTIAIGVAFEPAVVLALAVLVAVRLLGSRARVRGLWLTFLSIVVGAALVFPMVPELTHGGGVALWSVVGRPDFAALSRLVLGRAPGSWPVAWFLPAAALLGFSVADRERRWKAWRALVAALAGVFLAWLSAAGWLPTPLSNPIVYVVLAAASMAALVGYGLASLSAGRVGRESFGYRQVGAGFLTLVLTFGIGLQGLDAATAEWEIGPTGIPPAFQVTQAAQEGAFRILWLGRAGGDRFPAPGGDPQGTVEAGPMSLRYAVTDREGASALDTGRSALGPGYDYTERVLAELLDGTTSHAGTLLSPLGVRYLVAGVGDLPNAVLHRLDEQLDLVAVPAGGLIVYRNTRPLLPAAVIDDAAYADAASGTDLLALAQLPATKPSPLDRTPGGWSGRGVSGGLVLIGWQFDGGWRMVSNGHELQPREAFGWAISFPASDGELTVEYKDQRARTIEMIVLGLLWLMALWFTRKPVTR